MPHSWQQRPERRLVELACGQRQGTHRLAVVTADRGDQTGTPIGPGKLDGRFGRLGTRRHEVHVVQTGRGDLGEGLGCVRSGGLE